jgi:hypothetical protein
MENQSYVISDNHPGYQIPGYTVTPEYCPVKLTEDITLLLNGNSAITSDLTPN